MQRLRLNTRTAIALAVGLVLIAAVAVVLILALGGHHHHRSAPPQTVPGKDGAASWNEPWRPGNPQARVYGRAFQILDKAHPPKNAAKVYWIGTGSGKLYPYVRAMMGHGAEVMLSTVIYADKQSADYSHLVITSWDTKPFPTGQQTEGGKLLAQFNRGIKQISGSYSWVDARQPSAGWQAIVKIDAHTMLQVIRLDGFAPPLAKLVAELKPYPQP